MTPTTFFFDLGNVLVTFDWNLAIPRFAARNGGDTARVKQFLADPFHDAFERNEISGDTYYERGREMVGFQGTRAEFETYWNEIFREIPVNIRVLEQLANYFPVFALSNTNPWHAAYLEESFPWMDRFNERFYSFTLGARKPDRAIYRGAMEHAGVSAGSVLFIDDRLENIETARELGMQSIHLAAPDLLTASLEKFAIVPESL